MFRCAVLDEVRNHGTHHAADHLEHEAAVVQRQIPVAIAHAPVLLPEQGLPAQLRKRDQSRTQAVVHVMVVVGNRVRDVRDLGLEPRLPAFEEPDTEFAEDGGISRRAVLQNTLPRFEHQIQAGKVGVTLFELVDDPERLQVVLEAAEGAHAGIECVLAGMAERRMAQVVREADCLGQRLTEPERYGNRATYLGDFEGMREARTIQVAFVIDEDLGLVHQPPESGGVDDAIAIPLVFAAPGGRRFRVPAAPRLPLVGGVRGEPAASHPLQASSTASRRPSS